MQLERIFARTDEGCVAGDIGLEGKFDCELLKELTVKELDFRIEETKEGPPHTGGILSRAERSYHVFLSDEKSVILLYSKMQISTNRYSEQIHLVGNSEDIAALKGIILKAIAEKSYRMPSTPKD